MTDLFKVTPRHLNLDFDSATLTPSFCFSEPSRGGLPAVFLIFVLLLNLSVLELQDRN